MPVGEDETTEYGVAKLASAESLLPQLAGQLGQAASFLAIVQLAAMGLWLRAHRQYDLELPHLLISPAAFKATSMIGPGATAGEFDG